MPIVQIHRLGMNLDLIGEVLNLVCIEVANVFIFMPSNLYFKVGMKVDLIVCD